MWRADSEHAAAAAAGGVRTGAVGEHGAGQGVGAEMRPDPFASAPEPLALASVGLKAACAALRAHVTELSQRLRETGVRAGTRRGEPRVAGAVAEEEES